MFSVTVSNTSGISYQWNFNGSPIVGATGPTYSIASVHVSDSGSYTASVSGPGIAATSQGAILAVAPASGGPTFSSEPTGATLAMGSTVVFKVETAQAGATFQWYVNGVPLSLGVGQSIARRTVSPRVTGSTISGTTSPTLVISNATPADDGAYSCVITTAAGSALSSPATLNISGTGNPGRLINISCRAPVGTGPNILITGFVIGGAGTVGSEGVLIRASGPALAPFGVTGTLPDPSMEIFDSNSKPLAGNAGWAGAASIASAASAEGAFAWTDTSSHDAALLQTLAPGAYTAQVSGASGDTGVALAEVYDATPSGSYTVGTPRLINVSARVPVGKGPNILIAGFVIGGTTSKTVLIRASGPALAPFGVAGTLADPQLELYDSTSRPIAGNAGWGANAQIASIASSVGAFSWGNTATPDSALLVTLPPGAYTAQVSGASGDTGIALVEIYDVP